MKPNIVHVEDDIYLTDLLKIAFEAVAPGIELHQFMSGDEALPFIEKNADKIDLFILDIRLPGKMNGLEIAQWIRDTKCPGFIVLTSAYSTPGSKFLSDLHCEFYPKPWHILDVTQKLITYRVDTSKPAPSAC